MRQHCRLSRWDGGGQRSQTAAPEGELQTAERSARLKACPDTNLLLERNLLGLRSSSRSVLLRDRGLVAHGLPVPGAAHPHPGVAVGTAEIFAELVPLHVRPGSHNGGVAVD